jgi:hypothetical protein
MPVLRRSPLPPPAPSAILLLAGLVLAGFAPPAQAQQDRRRHRERHTEFELDLTLLMNGFWNDGRVNNSDVPQIALPPDPTDPLSDNSLGGTVRQTRATLTVRRDAVEPLGDAAATGVLDVDFFGGQQPSSGGRTFPLPRIRRAFGELEWEHVALLVGQESPPIASVSPSSIASIGFPDFASAGNLWLWLPQIRVTGLVPGRGEGEVRFGLEATVLAPNSGDAQTPFLTQPDRAERSERPFLEGRVLARWGAGEQAAEVSVGGHLGWLATAGGRVESRAAAVSAWVPIGRYVEVRGEAFTGRALAGLGGGGIGQSLGPGDRPVYTDGGWAQLNFFPVRSFELGGGFGIDDPHDGDLALASAASRLRNRAIEGHFIWRPRPLVVGLEVRDLETRYGAGIGDVSTTHVNLGAGMEF